MKVPFFKTTLVGTEMEEISHALHSRDSFADKNYVSLCQKWFADNHQIPNFFLTKSCTASLELAALILDIKEGDEVIMPSFAFVSCGNAFALRGAKCVYVDLHPETMNINEERVEEAITEKTRAILTVNYASVSCNYAKLRLIADKHSIAIVEDNAHGILAEYKKGVYLGTQGDIATFSFDHLKNITCGQGGGIAINNPKLLEKFFLNYEFGTNRRSFFLGNANRYEWKTLGSNYPISDLNAAMLYAQLQSAEQINDKFLSLIDLYFELLGHLRKAGKIELPSWPEDVKHNGHCFFIKVRDREERHDLIEFLNSKDINAQFHYTPLHNSEFGGHAGFFYGDDTYTTKESRRLLRLPIFYEMTPEMVQYVVSAITEFYSGRN